MSQSMVSSLLPSNEVYFDGSQNLPVKLNPPSIPLTVNTNASATTFGPGAGTQTRDYPITVTDKILVQSFLAVINMRSIANPNGIFTAQVVKNNQVISSSSIEPNQFNTNTGGAGVVLYETGALLTGSVSEKGDVYILRLVKVDALGICVYTFDASMTIVGQYI